MPANSALSSLSLVQVPRSGYGRGYNPLDPLAEFDRLRQFHFFADNLDLDIQLTISISLLLLPIGFKAYLLVHARVKKGWYCG
jgi:hypothetical protein